MKVSSILLTTLLIAAFAVGPATLFGQGENGIVLGHANHQVSFLSSSIQINGSRWSASYDGLYSWVNNTTMNKVSFGPRWADDMGYFGFAFGPGISNIFGTKFVHPQMTIEGGGKLNDFITLDGNLSIHNDPWEGYDLGGNWYGMATINGGLRIFENFWIIGAVSSSTEYSAGTFNWGHRIHYTGGIKAAF